MLILRLIFVLALLLLVLSVAMYVFTRNRRYLTFAWQVVRVTMLLLSVFVLLFLLERYVLTSWRVLL